MEATIWALLPPVIAIVLALLTKEGYSTLLVGILAGAFLFSGINPNNLYFSPLEKYLTLYL